MCQGLPCIDSKVRLNRGLLREGKEFPIGVRGEVVKEFQNTREIEVRVKYQGQYYSIRVGEYDVEIIERPLPS